MNYPGGKNNCYQHIINLTPPHELYIEPFLGSGAVLRHKRPAPASIAIDSDGCCVSAVIAEIGGTAVPSNIAVSADTANHGDAPDGITVATSDASCKFLVGDCLTWLQDNRHLLTPSTFIYADPPYVMRSRASQRDYYRYEYTDDDHIALLELLKSLPCQIMISGYWSQLYEDLLQGWNVSTFTAQTRGGRATEWLWTNYPEPVELHDYRYLGSDFRERERIKRKASRWVKRFKSLPLLERQCIVSQLQAHGVLQPR